MFRVPQKGQYVLTERWKVNFQGIFERFVENVRKYGNPNNK